MTDKLLNVDWWNKEKYRLKVQHNVSLIGSGIVLILFGLTVVYTLIKGSFVVPLTTFLALIFAILTSQIVKSQVDEKMKIFELLKLLFDKKEKEALLDG